MLRLSFHGAAETVTGSKYLLEADQARVMVDCGLFQGLKELRLRNWQPLPFRPADVQSVVLTHAHIDHTATCRGWSRMGFAARSIARRPPNRSPNLLLADAAHNQEEEADYANRKGFSKHKPALPLFDEQDAARAIEQLRAVDR